MQRQVKYFIAFKRAQNLAMFSRLMHVNHGAYSFAPAIGCMSQIKNYIKPIICEVTKHSKADVVLLDINYRYLFNIGSDCSENEASASVAFCRSSLHNKG